MSQTQLWFPNENPDDSAASSWLRSLPHTYKHVPSGATFECVGWFSKVMAPMLGVGQDTETMYNALEKINLCEQEQESQFEF